MIVDTSQYTEEVPACNERRFFGLKKNGEFLFKDENNKNIPFISLFVSNTKNKPQSESCFIQLSSDNGALKEKEYLLSIANNGFNIELYDLENYNTSSTSYLLYFRKFILTEINVFFKSSYISKTNYYHYFSPL